MDPEAKRRTSAGAIAMAVFYEKAYDWSLATNDPYLLKQISAPMCLRCKQIIDGLAKLQAEGGHVEGDRIRVDSFVLFFGTGKIRADHIVQVRTTQDAGGVAHPTATTNRNGVSRVTSYIYVSWIRGQWKILGDFG